MRICDWSSDVCSSDLEWVLCSIWRIGCGGLRIMCLSLLCVFCQATASTAAEQPAGHACQPRCGHRNAQNTERTRGVWREQGGVTLRVSINNMRLLCCGSLINFRLLAFLGAGSFLDRKSTRLNSSH